MFVQICRSWMLPSDTAVKQGGSHTWATALSGSCREAAIPGRLNASVDCRDGLRHILFHEAIVQLCLLESHDEQQAWFLFFGVGRKELLAQSAMRLVAADH